MTEPSPTAVLSVRGDARLEVPPDLAAMICTVQADDRQKVAALRAVAARLDAVLRDLRELGGSVPAPGEPRRPLVWLAHSANTHVETRWDRREEREIPTGRVLASVALRVEIRDFAIGDRVGEALAAHKAVHVMHVEWSVDADNAAWPQVRAAAIDAAIQKGRDYAAALGGSLLRIEHVADVGLLGAEGQPEMRAVSFSKHATVASEAAGNAPSLDPAPQELQAAIEARFIASVRPLA